MERINVALFAALEGFANDFCDVLKLFYAVEDYRVNAEETDGAEELRQLYEEKDGTRTDLFTETAFYQIGCSSPEVQLVRMIYGEVRNRF